MKFIIWLIISLSFVYFYENIVCYQDVFYYWPAMFIAAFPFVLFIVLATFNTLKLQKNSLPKKTGMVIGPKDIYLSQEGLKIKSLLCECVYSWKAVDEIIEFKGHVYVFLDTMVAFIFPSSCFSDDGVRQQLISQLNQSVAQNKTD